MTNPNRKGQSGSPVSLSSQSSNVTPFTNTSFFVPYGLRRQQTINAGTTSVVIPSGITWVYAICVGAGISGSNTSVIPTGGGGSGAISWGWTLAVSSCVVANSNSSIGTRYGNVIAASGGAYNTGAVLGSGGFGGGVSSTGVITGPSGGLANGTNYWAMPPGIAKTGILNGGNGAQGSGGRADAAGNAGNGGDGISGGGGASALLIGAQANIGGNGGNGIVGGGGGAGLNSTTSNTGGNGGNGFNILTNAITTGGSGSATGAGGGGAGVAGNGSAASGTTGGAGGLGGGAGGAGITGGSGGAGILYLYY